MKALTIIWFILLMVACFFFGCNYYHNDKADREERRKLRRIRREARQIEKQNKYLQNKYISPKP